MNNTKFAFWKYDLFPFYLCAEASGEVELKDGLPKIFVPDYSGKVTTFHVTTVEDGKEAANKLATLQGEYEQAKAKLWQEYKAKALQAAPFLKFVRAYDDK
jgi:hypothetical protein